jgi:hypothetical protein
MAPHATVQSEPMPRPCPRPAAPLLVCLVLLATSYLALTRLPTAAPLAALIAPSAGHGAIDSCAAFYRGSGRRAVTASVEEFGAVGDGVTSNTAAFRRAVAALEERAGGGGARLEVPPGRWLTGSFNLTSRFTLFLHHGAVILGSQVRVRPSMIHHPLIPLPFLVPSHLIAYISPLKSC